MAKPDPLMIAVRVPVERPTNQNWQINGENSDVHNEENYPDGMYGDGYVRRGLPSEMWLDRMVRPPLSNRESGYWPGNSEAEMQAFEADNRRERRSFRLTMGNVTGRFTGPPDRTR